MRIFRLSRNRFPHTVAVCLFLSVISGAGSLAGERLTVMTYNIRIGAGTDDYPKKRVRELEYEPEKLQPIVKAIASVDPDIVGLQEVRGEGQARRLAKALKMNFAFEWHFTRRPWWGVAILSKFKIVKAWGIEISPGPRNIKSIILATLDVGGRLVTAVSVHKDKDLEDGDSFKIIMKEVNRIKEPVILMGDFNVDPDDWRLGLLKPRFIDTVKAVNTKNAAYVQHEGTFFASQRRIDYVFINPHRFKVLDVGLIPYEHWEASDHLGYTTRVSLIP